MSQYIVEYSPQQGAFHIASPSKRTYRPSGRDHAAVFPVAGPFTNDAKAADTIVRLRPVKREIHARHR